ncbi:hypothetical protein C8R45DRAFT_927079 [Mycena sanguinolenta]|nr:hypothetical protein C8R45DRAFT_927079 [Mycena sanguinolenta]
MFTIKPLILLLAASLASAASPTIGRTTTYQACAVCPLFDTEGNAVSPPSGYGPGFSMDEGLKVDRRPSVVSKLWGEVGDNKSKQHASCLPPSFTIYSRKTRCVGGDEQVEVGAMTWRLRGHGQQPSSHVWMPLDLVWVLAAPTAMPTGTDQSSSDISTQSEPVSTYVSALASFSAVAVPAVVDGDPRLDVYIVPVLQRGSGAALRAGSDWRGCGERERRGRAMRV